MPINIRITKKNTYKSTSFFTLNNIALMCYFIKTLNQKKNYSRDVPLDFVVLNAFGSSFLQWIIENNVNIYFLTIFIIKLLVNHMISCYIYFSNSYFENCMQVK